MKANCSILSRSLIPLFGLAVSSLVWIPSTSHAVTYTWNGGSGNFSSGASWAGGVAAVSGLDTSLVFIPSATTTFTNDVSGTFLVNNITFSGAGAGTLNVGTSGTTITFAKNGSTDPSLVLNETGGRETINGSAKIAIQEGANLQISGANSNGNGLLISASITGSGGLTLNSNVNAPIFLNTSNSFTGGVTVNAGHLVVSNGSLGSGTLTLNGGLIRATSIANTATNTVVINGNVQFGTSSSAWGVNNTLTLSGSTLLAGSGSNYHLTICGTQASGLPVVLAGAIGDGGGGNGLVVTSVNSGSNVLVMNGAASNTYTGLTKVNGVSTTLRLGKTGGAIAINGNLNIEAGTVQLLQSNQIAASSAVIVSATGASGAVLDLNENSQTVGSLTTGGSLPTGVATITTGTTAAGTLTLGGNYTYVATNSTAGAVISGSGTLSLGTASRTFQIGHVAGAAADTTISTAIAGNGHTLIKSGAGILVLGGLSQVNANVTDGKLLVNNVLTGDVTVETGGVLGGSGTVNGTVSVNNGILAPGTDGVATLTINSVTFGANSIFLVDASDTAADLLVINGNLDLSSATDTLSLNLIGDTHQARYTIATYSGSLTGTFNDISSLTAKGYTVDYSVANEISIVAVPEPQTWTMMLGGLGLLAFVQQMRRGKVA